MKMNKTLKTGIKVVAGIAILFVFILAFHIITAKPAVYENANLQVSRIDFKNIIDSAQAKKISSDLKSIKGITSDSIIIKRNVLVYFHNNSITKVFRGNLLEVIPTLCKQPIFRFSHYRI